MINKKAEKGLLFPLVISLFMIIFAVMIIVVIEDSKQEFTKDCKKECNKFDYGFYKLEDNGWLEGYSCWCLDENDKPKDIGKVEE